MLSRIDWCGWSQMIPTQHGAPSWNTHSTDFSISTAASHDRAWAVVFAAARLTAQVPVPAPEMTREKFCGIISIQSPVILPVRRSEVM